MGCDIHLMAEVRHRYVDASKKPEEKREFWSWVAPAPEDRREPFNSNRHDAHAHLWHVAEWYSGRSYALFGILAGVRSDEEPIVEPRGLPEDMSHEVKHASEECDFFWLGDHSFSWLTLAELLEHRQRIAKVSPEFDKVITALQKVGPPEDVRIVFGFDN